MTWARQECPKSRTFEITSLNLNGRRLLEWQTRLWNGYSVSVVRPLENVRTLAKYRANEPIGNVSQT